MGFVGAAGSGAFSTVSCRAAAFSPFRGTPTLENYIDIVEQNFHISFGWSLWLALLIRRHDPAGHFLSPGRRTEADQAGRAKTGADLLTVADRGAAVRCREYPATGVGAVLWTRPAVLDGGLKVPDRRRSPAAWSPTFLQSSSAFVYIYLPFMLFPMILGLGECAARTCARSGIRIMGGSAAGACSATSSFLLRCTRYPDRRAPVLRDLSRRLCNEAKFLGKGVIVTVAQDIESAFTFGQNWPRGLGALGSGNPAGGVPRSGIAMRRMDIDQDAGKTQGRDGAMNDRRPHAPTCWALYVTLIILVTHLHPDAGCRFSLDLASHAFSSVPHPKRTSTKWYEDDL